MKAGLPYCVTKTGGWIGSPGPVFIICQPPFERPLKGFFNTKKKVLLMLNIYNVLIARNASQGQRLNKE